MYNIKVYKNTNFGNNDNVWNVPHPLYDFSQHDKIDYEDVNIRQSLFLNYISVESEWDNNLSYYDYLILFKVETQIIEEVPTEVEVEQARYFIESVMPVRNNVIFSLILDVISTYNIFQEPISGVLVRKMDINEDEDRFDYPTALNIVPNFENTVYDFIGYSTEVVRIIESAVNLTRLGDSVTLTSNSGAVTVPTLLRPDHVTTYKIGTWSGGEVIDNNRAFTLYLNDLVDPEIINTIRGLSGDGAISDSYCLPTESITAETTDAEISELKSNFLEKATKIKLEIDFEKGTPVGTPVYVPKNKAIEGMFSVKLQSTQEKSSLTFAGWDLSDSVDDDNFILVNLWADVKPSGTPFCCPSQVKTIFPVNTTDDLNKLATLEVKSVKGGQWLRNPLIYSTGKGELFATVESQMQRDRALFDEKSANDQLEIQNKQRLNDIDKESFNLDMALVNSVDLSNILNTGKTIINGIKNFTDRDFAGKDREIQRLSLDLQKLLIKTSTANNLRNLNVQESLRRIVPREVSFQSNESLGGYAGYNGFTISIVQPDIETLKAKDIEYSKYGYPVYESVENFNMLDNLRENHSVFQFDKPAISLGGKVGNMIRTVLSGGIRICSKKITPENLINNPKIIIPPVIP